MNNDLIATSFEFDGKHVTIIAGVGKTSYVLGGGYGGPPRYLKQVFPVRRHLA
ncbi:DUF2850 domain-containing protein [Vibrio lentus]|nr:DUF2850 domain-containing protein [Vibrio lentus]MCC4853361.1 DUF2850 domain-containing protein [Vibrio lentus]